MFLAMEGSRKSPSARYGYQWKENSTDGLLDHYTYQILAEVVDP